MAKKEAAISGDDYIAWQNEMGWSDAKAMRELGIGSHHTFTGYKVDGAPLLVALACNALLHRIGPYTRS